MTLPTSRPSSPWWALLLAGGALAVPGCAQQRGRPLPPGAFLAPREVNDRSRVEPVDQGGALRYEGGSAGESRPPAAQPRGPVTPTEATGPIEGVSATVQEAVRPVPEEGFQLPEDDRAGLPRAARGAPATGPSTAPAVAQDGSAGAPPATAPSPSPGPAAPLDPASPRRVASGPGPAPAPSPSTGGYQLVGTVLADVESEPIFADRVLAVLDTALGAEARKHDERRFRTVAAELIRQQVHEYIYNALEFAMARSRLDPRDQQLAKGAAIKWREEQITQAGGSAERARQAWAARGFDFEERVEEQYRTLMRQLYYQRKEAPKIQVSAADLRRYYTENLSREFTEPAKAKFRVIAVDKQKSGGREQALGEVHRLLDRVKSGGIEFDKLAEEDNDRPNFKTSAGWIPKGSFVVPEAEEAAWKLKPGQVGDPVETADAFYLVKVEALEGGRVLPFNERQVQARIERSLRDRQFSAIRSRVQQQLIQDAIIRYHPDEQGMLRTAVEMAAQKYNYWRSAR